MNKKVKNAAKSLGDDSGLVIIEATIVFPIMFFVLFFLLFFGNSFYVKSSVNSIVEEAAIKGASLVADPYLATIKSGNSVAKREQIKPYRYIFGDMGDIESMISSEVKKDIKKQSGFFSGMSPTIKSSKGNLAKYNNYVLYSTFSVEVEYSVKFPFRFIFSDKPTVIELSARAETPVGDPAEFIRNTDMVLDMLEGNETFEALKDMFGKVNSFLTSFANR